MNYQKPQVEKYKSLYYPTCCQKNRRRCSMSFELSEEHLQIKQEIHRLAQERIKPRAIEIDEQAEYPMDIFKLLSEYGYIGANMPEAYGGAELDLLSFCTIV